jgi:hypothetical protein
MSIISDVREVADLVKQLGNIELYKKIVDLESKIYELTQEDLASKGKISDLESSLKIRDELKFKQPYYYKEGDQVPFCPLCWEANQIPIHLIGPNYNNDRSVYYYCNHCGKAIPAR